MDDVVRPNFKQHTFSSSHQPAPAARAAGSETQRAKASVKHALLNAFDKLGNEAFFVELGRGSAEDRRCLAMILAKLLPIEVAGALDATLTVKVVTMIGEREVDITRPRPIPKDAAPLPALPVVLAGDRAPEEPGG